MNNIYDAEPKDRMHVDTKELHALINRMENMVDEQRLKTAPWELKNDKVVISKDKISVVGEISNPNSNLNSGKSENDVDQHEKKLANDTKAVMYKSSMKVIDSSLNIVIPERPEDSVQGYDAQMESYRNASHKVGSAGRRGPTQIVRPHTSRTPRKFTHKSSLYGNTGKRNENSATSYGRPRVRRPSTTSGVRSRSNTYSRHSNAKVKGPTFNKKIMISKRRKSPRTYPPHLSPSAYASIDVTEAQAKAMLQEGKGAQEINISTFRNSKITTALELSSRRWKKHSPRAASPTHVRLKEEVIRLERAVGTSKSKILQEQLQLDWEISIQCREVT